MASLKTYIEDIPKAELHIHIEGTLEPDLMFDIAKRNGIQLEGTVESHEDRRKNFKNLQDFLDIYYEACSVLKKEQDFYDLMYAYLRKASYNSVYVAEIFFDPQTHTDRGVSFETVVNGLYRALIDGLRDFEIRGSLIMCFLRHLPLENHLKTLEEAMPHLDKIIGVGLDSAEKDNEPHKFVEVFMKAAALGLKVVAHAGEEGGPEYVREALDLLHAARIDHGIQSLFDDSLVERLAREHIPLTTCPLSNRKLQVDARYFHGKCQTKNLLDKGLNISINSDDPAYFGGYLNDNFLMAAEETGLTAKDVYQICCNAFNSTFLSRVDKEHYLQKIKQFNYISGVAAPPKSVTIFGSRRPKLGDTQYDLAYKTASLLCSHGYQIVNGGYSGTMEASAHGANESGGRVIGSLIPRIFRSRKAYGNEFLTSHYHAHSLLERVLYMINSSFYFIIFPGTIGTVTELMTVWNESCIRDERGYPKMKLYAMRQPFEKMMEGVYSQLGVYKADTCLIQYFDSIDEVVSDILRDWEERSKTAVLTPD